MIFYGTKHQNVPSVNFNSFERNNFTHDVKFGCNEIIEFAGSNWFLL